MTLPTLADVERAHIRFALEMTRGNVTRSALILGIDRKTLKRRMRNIPGLMEVIRHYRETPPVVQEVDL